MHHYGWTSGETVIQVTTMGPFNVTYIDPKVMEDLQLAPGRLKYLIKSFPNTRANDWKLPKST